MHKADIYDQVHALLDRVSAETGHLYDWTDPHPRQLDGPYTIEIRRALRPDGTRTEVTHPQRSFTIPAGWWEGLCCLTVDGKRGGACWRTWSTNYERTRRKAERGLLLFLIRMNERGEWP